MERNIQRHGLINLLALLIVGAAGFAVSRYANSLAGLVSILFLGVGLLVALSLFGLFALVLFLLGKFSAAITRLERHRLLRPGASYLLLGAYLCFVVALGIVGVQAGFSRTDFYIGNVFCGLQWLIAIETL